MSFLFSIGFTSFTSGSKVSAALPAAPCDSPKLFAGGSEIWAAPPAAPSGLPKFVAPVIYSAAPVSTGEGKEGLGVSTRLVERTPCR